jgi:hypothetical protein
MARDTLMRKATSPRMVARRGSQRVPLPSKGLGRQVGEGWHDGRQ